MTTYTMVVCFLGSSYDQYFHTGKCAESQVAKVTWECILRRSRRPLSLPAPVCSAVESADCNACKEVVESCNHVLREGKRMIHVSFPVVFGVESFDGFDEKRFRVIISHAHHKVVWSASVISCFLPSLRRRKEDRERERGTGVPSFPLFSVSYPPRRRAGPEVTPIVLL